MPPSRGEGCEVTFKQIAGLLARRIVFNFKVGDTLTRGQRVGLIKFGSRVDVLLPAEAEIRVKVGQKVNGGVMYWPSCLKENAREPH